MTIAGAGICQPTPAFPSPLRLEYARAISGVRPLMPGGTMIGTCCSKSPMLVTGFSNEDCPPGSAVAVAVAGGGAGAYTLGPLPLAVGLAPPLGCPGG